MTKDKFQTARDEEISRLFPTKGPCLVPHKSAATKDSMLLTCHENDFCLCNMRAIADWAREFTDKESAARIYQMAQAFGACVNENGKLRAENAHLKSYIAEDKDYFDNFSYAQKNASLRAENAKLRAALSSWVKYEEEQIAKDGPYVSLNIPMYIAKAKAALEGK